MTEQRIQWTEIVDLPELHGHFWHFNASNLPDKMTWMHSELMRLYRGGFATPVDAYKEMGALMLKFGTLNAEIISSHGSMIVFFLVGDLFNPIKVEINLSLKCRYIVQTPEGNLPSTGN